MSEEQPGAVLVAPVLKAALASQQPGEDFDEALLRALKAAHAEQAGVLLPVVLQLIAAEMARTHEDRVQTIQRLAVSDPGPRVRVKQTDVGPIHTSVTSTVYRVNGKEYHSLDELPADIRGAVQAALGRKPEAALGPGPQTLPGLPRTDDRRPIRLGCSMALVALLWRLVAR